jgi:ketosteroid isomerase-like protein
MRTFAALLLFFQCPLLWTQASGQGITEAETAQIEAAVTAVGDQWIAAMEDFDTETLLSLCDSATMHANDGASYFATFAEWRVHVEGLFDGFAAGEDGKWVDTRIDVLSKDAAHFVGQSDLTLTREDGQKVLVELSISILTRNLDGSWKITYLSSFGRMTRV